MDGIERYLAGKLRGLPDGITFYWADVPAGDVIYVPWRFFHQVHNMTESIEMSRYYVALGSGPTRRVCSGHLARALTSGALRLSGLKLPSRAAR